MRDAIQTVAPTDQPLLGLDQAKLWLGVTHDSENELITELIEVDAVADIELITNYQLFTATWELTDDGNQYWNDPCGFELPYPPTQSVTKMEWVDTEGTKTLIAASDYNLVDIGVTSTVIITDDGFTNISASITASEKRFAFYLITYVSGYGTLQADLPKWTQRPAKQLVADYYDMRAGADSKSGNKAKSRVAQELMGRRLEIL